MLRKLLDDEYISERNISFIKRVYTLRQCGVILCSIPICSVLNEQAQSLFLVAILIINVLFWPSLAYLLSVFSRDMLNAEKRNMILDSFWAGIWIAIINASPIPSIFILSIQITDRYAAGGWKILKPALMCMILTFMVVWTLKDFSYQSNFSDRTVWLSLPLATCYPILLSIVSRRLSLRAYPNRILFQTMTPQEKCSIAS